MSRCYNVCDVWFRSVTMYSPNWWAHFIVFKKTCEFYMSIITSKEILSFVTSLWLMQLKSNCMGQKTSCKIWLQKTRFLLMLKDVS
jgi:hypothetical protein